MEKDQFKSVPYKIQKTKDDIAEVLEAYDLAKSLYPYENLLATKSRVDERE